MKLKLLALFAGSALLTACASNEPAENHWNLQTLGPRMSKHFLGYRADIDGDYRTHQWKQKKDINLTLRRHFLNNNPENPFQAPDPNRLERGPHSILPDPLYYFHLEAIVMGAITYGAFGFPIPIPVGSVIASFQDGGGSEFVQGLGAPFSGSYSGPIGEPDSPKKFKVRNR